MYEYTKKKTSKIKIYFKSIKMYKNVCIIVSFQNRGILHFDLWLTQCSLNSL